jgi:hypothetical protein
MSPFGAVMTPWFSRRRDQVDRTARMRVDRPGVGHLAGIARIGEAEAAGEEILVREMEARGHEAGGVDARTCTDHHAIGVDQEDAAVRQQLAEERRLPGAGDAVQYRARRAALDERVVRGADRERLPVDDRAGVLVTVSVLPVAAKLAARWPPADPSVGVNDARSWRPPLADQLALGGGARRHSGHFSAVLSRSTHETSSTHLARTRAGLRTGTPRNGAPLGEWHGA